MDSTYSSVNTYLSLCVCIVNLNKVKFLLWYSILILKTTQLYVTDQNQNTSSTARLNQRTVGIFLLRDIPPSRPRLRWVGKVYAWLLVELSCSTCYMNIIIAAREIWKYIHQIVVFHRIWKYICFFGLFLLCASVFSLWRPEPHQISESPNYGIRRCTELSLFISFLSILPCVYNGHFDFYTQVFSYETS